MHKTIRVSSRGSTKAKVDTIVLNLDFEALEKDYQQALDKTNSKKTDLIKIVLDNGFLKDDLKTVSFDINASYKSYHDKNNVYQREFIGYRSAESLKLEFDFDTTVLKNLLNAISKTDVNPNINIDFSIKDKESMKEKMLMDATNKAFKDAKTLANAANCTLGELLSIDYSFNQIKFESPTVLRLANDQANLSTSYNINPEDIEIADNVTFIWEIK